MISHRNIIYEDVHFLVSGCFYFKMQPKGKRNVVFICNSSIFCNPFGMRVFSTEPSFMAKYISQLFFKMPPKIRESAGFFKKEVPVKKSFAVLVFKFQRTEGNVNIEVTSCFATAPPHCVTKDSKSRYDALHHSKKMFYAECSNG